MDLYTNNINFNPDIKDICIFSYNSRGFHEDNQAVCKDLPKIAGNKFSIICNQENFLLKGDKYKIEQCLPDHHIYFKPATKVGLTGRPKHGMFVAIPKHLKAHVTDVSPASSPAFIENDFNEYIWTGDINADFGRKTRFVDLVETYVNDNNMIRSWERFDVDFTHAHNSGDITYTSTIDHFFWNSCLDTHVLRWKACGKWQYFSILSKIQKTLILMQNLS